MFRNIGMAQRKRKVVQTELEQEDYETLSSLARSRGMADLRAQAHSLQPWVAYIATAAGEGCSFFVTTDERHLLKEECRSALSTRIGVCTPAEAVEKV